MRYSLSIIARFIVAWDNNIISQSILWTITSPPYDPLANILPSGDQAKQRTSISWPAVHAQFGTGFKAVRQFKPRFTEALQAALAAYPEARVDLGDKAITLHPSRPPIARLA